MICLLNSTMASPIDRPAVTESGKRETSGSSPTQTRESRDSTVSRTLSRKGREAVIVMLSSFAFNSLPLPALPGFDSIIAYKTHLSAEVAVLDWSDPMGSVGYAG